MEKKTNPETLLEDEWYHVRYSGEIPEIALHSSIYYLTEDPEGPGLSLDEKAVSFLHEAVLARYQDIIVRDITPENRDTSMYRGVLRAIANWRRMKRFCSRHLLGYDEINNEVSRLLLTFLENEIQESKEEKSTNRLNCSFDDLYSFALELGISLDHMKKELKPLCLDLS